MKLVPAVGSRSDSTLWGAEPTNGLTNTMQNAFESLRVMGFIIRIFVMREKQNNQTQEGENKKAIKGNKYNTISV